MAISNPALGIANNKKDKLISFEEVVSRTREMGVSWGKGDPNNRLRYYTKIGLLPKATRKSFNGAPPSGAYPENVIPLIYQLDQKLKAGLSVQAILRGETKLKEEQTLEPFELVKPKEKEVEVDFETPNFKVTLVPALKTKVSEPEPEIVSEVSYKSSPFSFLAFTPRRQLFELPWKNLALATSFASLLLLALLSIITFTKGLVSTYPTQALKVEDLAVNLPNQGSVLASSTSPYFNVHVDTDFYKGVGFKDANSEFRGLLNIANLTQDQNYILPDQSGTLCLTTGNCASAGGGITTGGSITGGTVGFIPVFTASQSIGNSLISQTGSVLNFGSSLSNFSGTLSSSGTISVGSLAASSGTGLCLNGTTLASCLGGTGDISAVGDVTSGDAFTNGGFGNELYFHNGFQGLLTATSLTNDRTYTLPDLSGTFALQNVSSFTPGSVIFADANGLLSQDNANFFWDNTNNRLGLGTLSPTGSLDIASTQTSGGLIHLSPSGTPNLTGDLYGIDINLGNYTPTINQRYGINIASISNTVRNDAGIRIGSGWDYGLYLTGGESASLYGLAGTYRDPTTRILKLENIATDYQGDFLDFDIQGIAAKHVLRYPNTPPGVFVDNTTEANNVGGTAFILLSSTSDYTYLETSNTVGPFTAIQIDLSTVATSPQTLVWEYCNNNSGDDQNPCANWSSLTISSDTTNGFSQDGQVSFVAPNDWVSSVGSEAFNNLTYRGYYVRVHAPSYNSAAAPTAFYFTPSITTTGKVVNLNKSQSSFFSIDYQGTTTISPYLNNTPALVINSALVDSNSPFASAKIVGSNITNPATNINQSSFQISSGSMTINTATSPTYRGFYFSPSGIASSNNASAVVNFRGADIEIPTVIATNGSSVTADGVRISFLNQFGSSQNGGTVNGLEIVPPTTAGSAGSLYGINIGNISAGAGVSEVGINIGTGWDVGLWVKSNIRIDGTLPTPDPVNDTTEVLCRRSSDNLVSACSSSGGVPNSAFVHLAPQAPGDPNTSLYDIDPSTRNSIYINKTGASGDLINICTGAACVTSKFVVDFSGNITNAGDLTLGANPSLSNSSGDLTITAASELNFSNDVLNFGSCCANKTWNIGDNGSSTNLTLQNPGTASLNVTFEGNLTAGGSLTVNGGFVNFGTDTTIGDGGDAITLDSNGTVVINDAILTINGNGATSVALQSAASGGQKTITFPNANGTVCLDDTVNNCNYVPQARTLTAGTGLTGGGDLTTNRSFAVDQNYNFAWTANHSWTSTLTNTGAIQTISLTLGDDADQDVVIGLNVDVTSANTGDSDLLYGANFANVTSPSASVIETALRIGTGYDNLIELEGSTNDNNEIYITVEDPAADRTYTIPYNPSAATDTFCLVSLGNCGGSGGGVTTVGGVSTRVAFFTGTQAIDDDDNFFWDNTAKGLILGNASTSASARLHIQPSTAAGLQIDQFGTGAGQTGELRLQEGGASPNNYTGFKAPDSISSNLILTLPSNAGGSDYVLTTNGSGILSWQSVSGGGLGTGTITAVGDVTSGNAFDGTAGNTLQFEGTTVDNFEISLTGADATGDQTITLPDNTGTIALINPTSVQTASGSTSVLWFNETHAGSPNLIEMEVNGVDKFRVDNSGNLLGNATATATTANTNAATTNGNTLSFAAAAPFATNDILYIDNSGTDYWTRCTANCNTTTITVSPVVSADNGATVTKYNAQNLGATSADYSTTSNRYFQGYFLGGIVTGNASTIYSERNILGNATSGNLLNLGAAGSVTLGGNLTGLNIDLDSRYTPGSNNRTGINIASLNSGTGTSESAISIGSGWDNAINFTAASNLAIIDNSLTSLTVSQGANSYLTINTNSNNKVVTLDSPVAGALSNTINIGTSNINKTINLGGGAAQIFNFGANATTGTFNFGSVGNNNSFTFSSGSTTTSVFSLATNSITTGTAAQISVANITSGKGLYIAGASNGGFTSGNLLRVGLDESAVGFDGQTLSGNVVEFKESLYSNNLDGLGGVLTTTRNGNLLNINREWFYDGNEGEINISGDVVSISSTNSLNVNGGNPIDSSSILSLNQTWSGATGAVLKISNSGSGASIYSTGISGSYGFTVDNISQQFGALAETGGFLSHNAYFGEEFSRERADETTTGVLKWGDDTKFAIDVTSGSCTVSIVDNNVNGISRLNPSGAGSYSCALYNSGTGAGTGNTMFAAANRPVILMKVRPNAASSTRFVIAGITDRVTGRTTDLTTAGDDGIYFSNFDGSNAGTGNWYGKISSNGSVTTTASCGAVNTGATQFALLKIIVVSTTSVEFWIDRDTSDGVSFTLCGTLTTTPSVGLNAYVNAAGSSAGGEVVDVDFVRIWQDDNPLDEAGNLNANPENPEVADSSAVIQTKNQEVLSFIETDTEKNLVATLSSQSSFLFQDVFGTVVASISDTGEALFKTVEASIIKVRRLVIGEAITIKNDAQIAGSVKIEQGQAEVVINTNKVKDNSLIYLTAKSRTSGLNLYVKEIKAGESFTVGLEKGVNEATASASREIEFNWLIVDQE